MYWWPPERKDGRERSCRCWEKDSLPETRKTRVNQVNPYFRPSAKAPEARGRMEFKEEWGSMVVGILPSSPGEYYRLVTQALRESPALGPLRQRCSQDQTSAIQLVLLPKPHVSAASGKSLKLSQL